MDHDKTTNEYLALILETLEEILVTLREAQEPEDSDSDLAMYVALDEVEDYVAKGWKYTPGLHETHHGTYAVLMVKHGQKDTDDEGEAGGGPPPAS